MTHMWLFIEGQLAPQNLLDVSGDGRAGDEFWYELNTGAVVYCTRDPETFKRVEEDRIRVWTLASAETKFPVDVTKALTGKEWVYTKSELADNFERTRKAVVAKLNEVLEVEQPARD